MTDTAHIRMKYAWGSAHGGTSPKERYDEFELWLQQTLDEHSKKVLEGYARMVEKHMEPDRLWGPGDVVHDIRSWVDDGMFSDLVEEAEGV